MSLCNELRQPLTKFELYTKSYNWETWHSLSRLGADAIKAANHNFLIFLSGIDSSTNFSVVAQGLPLTPGTVIFSPASFGSYADKLVIEMHSYDPAPDCTAFGKKLFNLGFQTLDASAKNILPLVMTEFGFQQSNQTYKNVYATCLEKFLPVQRVGWMVWVLSGGYYVRERAQDYDETWGLLTHDWSGWREPGYVEEALRPMVNASLEVKTAVMDSAASMGGVGGATLVCWLVVMVFVGMAVQ